MDSKPSLRQQKVSRLIQKELGQFFQRERLAICNGQFVTVTNVRITPDLSIAYIYLSIFPSEKAKTAVVVFTPIQLPFNTELSEPASS